MSRAGSTRRRRRDGRDRADARRPRKPRKARAQPRQEGAAGRQGSEDPGVACSARRSSCCASSKPARLTEPKDIEEKLGAGARAAADRQARPLRLQCRRGRRRRRQCADARACSRRPRRKAPGGHHLGRDRGRDRDLPADERDEFLADLGLTRPASRGSSAPATTCST